jgi:hypothetical protein
MVPYSAAVFMGLSYLFTSNFGIAYEYALLFMGILTALYLVMGGYKSMSRIDMIFGFIMTAGCDHFIYKHCAGRRRACQHHQFLARDPAGTYQSYWPSGLVAIVFTGFSYQHCSFCHAPAWFRNFMPSAIANRLGSE